MTDITKEIGHGSVLKATANKNVGRDLLSFRDNDSPILIEFVHVLSNLKGFFTDEKWRYIWLTAVYLCFDVREKGYVLSKETFDLDNMSIVGRKHLMFKKLFGTPLGVHPVLTDFQAVATMIKSLFGTNNIPRDVSLLLGHLNESKLHLCPLDDEHKALIKCHYALMPNCLRTRFLENLWEEGLINTKVQKAFRSIGTAYYPNSSTPWSIIPMSMNPKAPLSLVYFFGVCYNPKYTDHVFKFIRHALVHLVTDQGFSSEDALMMVSCCYDELIPNLQKQLLQRGVFGETELYKHQPPMY